MMLLHFQKRKAMIWHKNNVMLISDCHDITLIDSSRKETKGLFLELYNCFV